MGSRQGS